MHGETGDPTPEAPTISIAGGVSGFGVEFWHPINFTQNNFEMKNTLTTNRGQHSFRMGGELRMAMDIQRSCTTGSGRTTTSPCRSARPAAPASSISPMTRRSRNGAASIRRRACRRSRSGDNRGREFALFVQDNWKIRSNITLNLGLRYEVFMAPTKTNGSFGGIILGQGATRQEQMRERARRRDRSALHTDWNNFAPRLGMAWDLDGSGNTVLRAGAGMSYNRINNTVWSDEQPESAVLRQCVRDGAGRHADRLHARPELSARIRRSRAASTSGAASADRASICA